MKTLRFLAAAAAVGGMAAPALAQYQPYPQYQQQYPQYQQQYPQYQQQYPQYQQQYPQYQQQYPQYQQQYPQQGGIAGIIGQLLGNRYTAVPDRTAIAQCAAAAQQQAAAQVGGQQPYGNAYGYRNNAYASARVTGITSVERRQNGLRVTGVMSSGRSYGAYGNQGYNRGYAAATNDLTFRCNVDYRGAVTNVRVRANTGYNG